eukprot:GGOE01003621.1.p1 GENE.GGOE01003621.1~~GGOE01003621.1.p1  ORF type:complete len:584 (-),score=150.80 GGOE01003621.1:569-2227(-)
MEANNAMGTPPISPIPSVPPRTPQGDTAASHFSDLCKCSPLPHGLRPYHEACPNVRLMDCVICGHVRPTCDCPAQPSPAATKPVHVQARRNSLGDQPRQMPWRMSMTPMWSPGPSSRPQPSTPVRMNHGVLSNVSGVRARLQQLFEDSAAARDIHMAQETTLMGILQDADEMDKERRTMADSMARLRSEASLLEDANSQLLLENSHRRRTIDELRRRLEAAEKQAAQNAELAKATRDAHLASQQEMKEMREAMGALECHGEALSSTLDAERLHWKAAEDAWAVARGRCEAECARLQLELANSNAKCAELDATRATLQQLEVTAVQLRAGLEEEQRTCAELRARKAQLEEEMVQLRGEAARLKPFEAELGGATQLLRQSEQRIYSLEEESQTLQKQKAQADDDCSHLRLQLQSLENQLHASQQETKRVREDLEQRLHKLGMDLEAEAVRLTRKTEDYDDVKAKLEVTQKELRRVAEELVAEEARRRGTESELFVLRSTLETTQLKGQSLVEEVERLRRSNEILLPQRDTLQDRVRLLESVLRTARDEFTRHLP